MSVPTSPGWHLSEVALRDYTSGDTLPVAGASVEAHLIQCADCRTRLGAVMPREALNLTWTKIRDKVETPHVSVVERLLRQARHVGGVGPHPGGRPGLPRGVAARASSW